MKNWLIGALVVALVGTTAPTLSEAKRLGGSKNSGMQRDMPARTAPDTPPAKPPRRPSSRARRRNKPHPPRPARLPRPALPQPPSARGWARSPAWRLVWVWWP
jgi:hypothetical protein